MTKTQTFLKGIQNMGAVAEAGRTKDGSLVFRFKGCPKFGRWSKPGRVFAHLAETQEPEEA